MCPACLTTAVLTLAGATSTGGLTVLLMKKLSGQKCEPKAGSANSTSSQKEKSHEHT
jgi:hypothetical protein